MKKTRVATRISYTGSLGMLALNIEDQNGEASTFHFLPSHFRTFAETTAQVYEQAPPAEMLVAAPIPKIDCGPRQTAEAAAKWAQSQSAAFAVLVNPVENVSFLCLRSGGGRDEAIVPLDAETIGKLVAALLQAKDAIRPGAAEKH